MTTTVSVMNVIKMEVQDILYPDNGKTGDFHVRNIILTDDAGAKVEIKIFSDYPLE